MKDRKMGNIVILPVTKSEIIPAGISQGSNDLRLSNSKKHDMMQLSISKRTWPLTWHPLWKKAGRKLRIVKYVKYDRNSCGATQELDGDRGDIKVGNDYWYTIKKFGWK